MEFAGIFTVKRQYEIDNGLFAAPGNYAQVASKPSVRVIVMHSMEAPEKGDITEDIAEYLCTAITLASIGICVDNNRIFPCVLDNEVAEAALGANGNDIHIEVPITPSGREPIG